MQGYLQQVRLAVRKRIQAGKSFRSIADASGLTSPVIQALYHDARASDDTIGRLLGWLENEKRANDAKVDAIASGLFDPAQKKSKKRTDAAHWRYCLALWTEMTGSYGLTTSHPREWWHEPTDTRRAHEAKMEIQCKRALLSLYPAKGRQLLPDSQDYFQWKERLTGKKQKYRSPDTPASPSSPGAC